MTPDEGDGTEALDREQSASTAPGSSRMQEATPRQAIVAVAVLCGLCLVIGFILGRTL